MVGVSLSVPMVPPSVNHYVRHVWRGNRVSHYRTSEADGFINTVAVLARDKLLPVGEYGIRLTIYLGKNQKGDIDNFPKVVLDSLKGQVIHSDGAVKYLEIHLERDWARPRTEIEAWVL